MTRAAAAFAVAMAWLRPAEGGRHDPDTADPHPTMRGVTQEEYDLYRDRQRQSRQSVFLISDPEVDDLYQRDYWTALNCGAIPFPLSLCVFDTGVNCGPPNARKLLARTTDVRTYLQLRGAYYRALAAAKPAKAPNLAGWLNRNTHLAMACGVSL